MKVLITNKGKPMPIEIYYTLVLKELRKYTKKIKPINQKVQRDIDKYRAYQKQYQKKYYQTKIKPTKIPKRQKKIKS